MRRLSPKIMVLVAGVLTLLLLAFVFAGGASRSDNPPTDRLSDREAGALGRGTEPPADPWATLPGNESASDEVAMAPEQTDPSVAPPPPPPPVPVAQPSPPAAPRAQPTPRAEPTSRALPAARAKPAPRAQPVQRAEAKPRTQSAPRKEAAVVRRVPERVAERKAAAPKVAAPKVAARTTVDAKTSPPRAGARPSYNCRYARTGSEIAVCRDEGLASLDRQMAAQFNNAVREGTPAQRDVLERSRMRFLYRRERCGSAACISAAYRARMNEINDIAARNWRVR